MCFFLPFAGNAHTGQKVFTIMLEPARDAKDTGRPIDDCFERGITLQFTEKLKKNLETEYPTIRVILSRFAGESLEPFQNANFANRLDVDLYLSFHFFEEKEEKPILYLYHFVYNKTTDYWSQNNTLQFIPYDQAHRTNLILTKKYAEHMHEALQSFKKQFEVKAPISFPFQPLIGIQAPALAIEASLKAKDEWSIYLDPIVQSLKAILDYDLS